MRKKIFALTMALTMAVGLAACGAKETGNEIDPDLKELQDELKGETGGQSGSSASGSSSDSGINSKEIRALIDSINADTAELYGKCGENLDWYYKDGTMVIKGSGEMWDSGEFDDSNQSLWDSVTDSNNINIQQLIVDDGVTSIGSGAFGDCKSLTDVVLADSILSFGINAFASSPWMEKKENEREDHLVIIGKVLYDGKEASGSVTIPEGVVSIRDKAFEALYGSGVTKVTVPESVTSIGFHAFYGTPFLEQKRNEREDHLVIINGILVDGQKAEGDVIIPEGVVSISPGAFYGYDYTSSKLTSVTIGDGVTSIGDSAFRNCTGLTSVTIGDGVTSIGDDAFMECGVTSVTIGNGVTSIGDRAFMICVHLTSVELPSGVTLGEGAFGSQVAITYR